MSDQIDTWHAEHVNFNRLLALVDNQIAQLATGERPDYELMLDIMYYMTHYPDRYHHPMEDGALEILAKRDENVRAAVAELYEQHREISRSGTKLVDELGAIVDGAMVARAEVEADAATYTGFLRRHMQKEENELFPLLRELLTEDDWRTLDSLQQQGGDPIFGGEASQRFREIQSQIARQADCGCDLPKP